MKKGPIVIIGAGPAGLMAAQLLAERGYQVSIYEKNKAAARKFLVAGHGGFNLTHSEAIDAFVEKYDAHQIRMIVRSFDNNATVQWLSSIGIPTYVGSSGKIFPAKDMKPIQVLQAWLGHLEQLGVSIHYGCTLLDFDTDSITLAHNDAIITKPYHRLVLAMGGGSWAKTGSDASWISLLVRKNIEVTPLQPANSGYNTSDDFSDLEGQVLKNIQVTFDSTAKLGELVFTKYGIEGSPLYYLNRFTRGRDFPLDLRIDLKPKMTIEAIIRHLQTTGTISSLLKNNVKLSHTAIALLKRLDKQTFLTPHNLATMIKNYPIQVCGLRPIDEVISTAGGVAFTSLDPSLALHQYPNVYCVGEMIDWEAPTGGYLLQACFSTGAWVGKAITD